MKGGKIMIIFICICLHKSEETMEGYTTIHRDQDWGKRDGNICGSKTSPCMTSDIIYLIKYKSI